MDNVLITCKPGDISIGIEGYLMEFDSYKKEYRNGIYYFYLDDIDWNEDEHQACRDVAIVLSGLAEDSYAFIRTSETPGDVQFNGSPNLFGLSIKVTEE